MDKQPVEELKRALMELKRALMDSPLGRFLKFVLDWMAKRLERR